jgi:hypothetical protein
VLRRVGLEPAFGPRGGIASAATRKNPSLNNNASVIIPLHLVRKCCDSPLRDPFGPNYKPVGSGAYEVKRITGNQGENLISTGLQHSYIARAHHLGR